MKIKKFIRNLIVILILCCSLSVNAEEHDVVAKYGESKNVVTYESVIRNGEASVNIDAGTITICCDSKALEGANVLIIKTSGDALNWIKDVSKTNYNYYFYFEKNSLKLDINDKIVVKFTSNDGVVKQLAIYNTSGELVSKSDDLVFSYKSNFYFSFSDVAQNNLSNEMELNIDSNGKIMIDGAFYEGSSKYASNNDSVRVAIIPNNGYEVLQILYNGEDITDNLKNGFITLKLKEPNKLNVKFTPKKEYGDGIYKISGKVMLDGKPLSDAIVTLNDNEKVVTDSNGYYEFDNVPAGVNSLLIMKDGKGVGFATFEILSSEIKNINTYNDDLFVIEISKDSSSFIMDINVNDDYSLDFDNVQLDTNCNLWWLLIVFIVVIVLFVILYKRKAGKK